MKAYAFEWDSTINPPYAGGAVVAAATVSQARAVLREVLVKKGLKLETLQNANTTKPGPYWTGVAKGLPAPKMLYFSEG